MAWLFPASRFKNRILTKLGHSVHPTAVAHASLVLRVDDLVLGPHASLGQANLIRNLQLVHLGARCSVGRLNVMTSKLSRPFESSSHAVLRLETGSKITSRHQIDCSGGLFIGAFASIAGHEVRFYSFGANRLAAGSTALPISIGPRSFIGARCIILAGAVFPGASVLAAGSVFSPQEEEPMGGLWAGNPAVRKGPVTGEWFERDETSTKSVYLPQEGRVEDEAL